MKIKKEHIIVLVATVLPFGLVALGIWKAAELIKKPENKDEKSSSI